MKKNDFILLIAVFAYSFLFFHQLPGVNFIIFNLLLTGLLLWQDTSLLKNRNWLITALCSLATSAFVFTVGSSLSLVANITSLLLLSAMSFSRNSSVFMGFLYSVYSAGGSITFMILDIIDRKRSKAVVKKSGFWKNLLLITGGFLVIFILFLLYRESNPLFKDFTKNINLDFISLSWVRFTLTGLILLYGFFYHRSIAPLYRYDISVSSKINPGAGENSEKNGIRRFINIDTEWRSGLILLVLLNLLIVIVNILDAVYLWAGSGLPAGMNFSESVHQGVGTLIFSIIIAICIILFFFRSEMNFYKGSKIIKFFALLWVLQNIFMVISTIYRNHEYISEYSLTYKRTGVYIYLILAVAGLVSTFIKIYSSRKNWYLFRFNGWSFFLVLVIAAGFNWDRIITKYNIANSKILDTGYLLKMSETNIPDLLLLDYEKKLEGAIPQNYKKPVLTNEEKSEWNFSPKTFQNVLHLKLYKFLEAYNTYNWKSWCIDRQRVKSEIMTLEKQGKIKEIDLSNNNLATIDPITSLSHLKSLNLKNNLIEDHSQLAVFTELENLDLSKNKINITDKLSSLKKLKKLKLALNIIVDLKPLQSLDNLELLDISENRNINFASLPVMEKLNYLDISGNMIKNYSYLKNLKSLKTLVLSNAINKNISTIPDFENLQTLCISNNNISTMNYILMSKLRTYKTLTELDISQNNIESLYAFSAPAPSEKRLKTEVLFPALKTLNVSSNKINELYGVEYFSALEELNVTANRIEFLEPLKDMKTISELYIGNNRIADIKTLKNLTKLHVLNVSGNPVSNPEILNDLKLLDTLYAANLGLQNVSCVSALANLKYLGVSGNNITDITLLGKLPKLSTLDISNNPVKDYSPLYKMKSLKILYISYVSNDAYEELQSMLPNTLIYSDYYLRTIK